MEPKPGVGPGLVGGERSDSERLSLAPGASGERTRLGIASNKTKDNRDSSPLLTGSLIKLV